jgi:transposase InsO family protein
MSIVGVFFLFVRGLLAGRARLAAENLALRQQVAILKHATPRPKLRPRDRVFWVWLSRLWAEWRSALAIVQPETVIRWHRQGFRLYWRWKSGASPVGRPRVEREIRDLIRRMAQENPLWGAPRIAAELHFLGYDVADSTVAKYLPHGRKPPSQTWRTFLANHVDQIAAIDFFTVPTATFRVLFCCLILRHARRTVVHFHVTAHPTAGWTAQQVVEAFPYDDAPRYLLHDRDSVYGDTFRRRMRGLGIEEVRIAPHAPWQNPYIERLIGSLRRECLDHAIILGEAHLRRILAAYLRYYHEARPHLALARNAPVPRAVEAPSWGKVVALPHLGGLHHRYTRAA